MADLLRALLETRSAVVVDVDAGPDGTDRVLVRSDLSGTRQLYLMEGGGLRQVTDLPEPVGAAALVAGRPKAVVEVDRGGDERHQLYLVDLDREGPSGLGDLEALTADPRYGHQLAGVSPDGSVVAYVSNKKNGVDFDLWCCPVTGGSDRLVYAGGTWCHPGGGFSPDGRYVALLAPGQRPLDADLLLVEAVTGLVRTVEEHPEEAASPSDPVWLADGTLLVASNVGRDRSALVRCDLDGGPSVPLGIAGVGDGTHEASLVGVPGGHDVLVVENVAAAHRLRILDLDARRVTEVPQVEPGAVMSHVIPPPCFSADGRRLYYTLSTPTRPPDVWRYDRETGVTEQLTHSPAAARPRELPGVELAEIESFDGERIPLHVYRPPAAGVPPVVVMVHGGPESQAMRLFDPIAQAFVAAGYAVVVPNVRGSTGYGKRYASLDDTTRRLDSVADLGAVHDWLAGAGLDADRAVLYGGSYGGYMVLAGLAFQPERWAAGVDVVGISDLVTFLQNTSPYRRAHREREYGSLDDDREFLASASPLRRADAIRAPLFVIHGRNDPRVPVGETHQLASALHERGVRCDLVIYDDEGHGLARLANRLDAYPKVFAFLADVVG